MGLLVDLESKLDSLPRAMRRLADFVLAHPEEAVHLTAAELCRRSGASRATVNRFCRLLGLQGYADLRVALAAEDGRRVRSDWLQTAGASVDPGAEIDRIGAALAVEDMQAVQLTHDGLEWDRLQAVVDRVVAASCVHLFGSGASFWAAAELRQRLQGIGLAAWAWSDPHEGLTAASGTTPTDVVILFSYSGRTPEALEVAQVAAGMRAAVVAITHYPDSPLAELSDLVLVTRSGPELAYRSAALSSRHAQLFLLDTIFVAVADRLGKSAMDSYERARMAISHHFAKP